MATDVLSHGTVRSCDHCGTAAPSLLRCSQCQAAWYCNRRCQSSAWKGHRNACRQRGNASSTAKPATGGSTAIVERTLEELHVLVHSELIDTRLDYQALCEAWRATAEPFFTIAQNRLDCKREATPGILASGSFVTVLPSPRSADYCIVDDEADAGDGEMISFGDTGIGREYTNHFHPFDGTSSCHMINSHNSKRTPSLVANSYSPITTTASRFLFSVAFADGRPMANDGKASSSNVVELRAAYRHQLSLRIDEDEAGRSFNLDCFEFKPTCLDVTNEDSPPLPTYKDLSNFDDALGLINMPSDSNEVVVPEDTAQASVVALNYQSMTGKFMHSRCFRLQIILSNIKGIRLMEKPVTGKECEGDNDIAAVLILETKQPLGGKGRGFAVRTVRANNNSDGFALCADWTPGNQIASTATRFYFYGNLRELKETAAVMAKLCPTLARMLQPKRRDGIRGNSLAANVPVDYDAVRHDESKQNGFEIDEEGEFELADIRPPSPSAWDGQIVNAREMFETLLAREPDTMKRTILRMTTDPESLIAMNQDPNASVEDKMLSKMACEHIIANKGTDGLVDQVINAGQNGEECCLM